MILSLRFIKNTRSISLVLLFICLYLQSFAATYYTRTNGNWNVASSWSLSDSSPQNAASNTPGPGDDVVILNNHTITVNSNSSVRSLTVRLGGILNVGTGTSNSGLLTLAGNATINGRLHIRTGGTLNASAYNMTINSGVNGNPTCNLGNSNIQIDGVLLVNNLSMEASCFYVSGVASISSSTPPGFVRVQNNLTILQRGDMQIAGLYLVGGNVNATQGNVDITGTGYFGVAGDAEYQNNGGPAISLNYCENSSILTCSTTYTCPFPSNDNTTNECNNVCRAYSCSGFATTFPLPVNLISFKAIAETTARQVRLQWITASEENNDYFVIERSKNAQEFEEIDRVNGGGTTSLTNTYSLVDEKPLAGISYYRLKQVDIDGKFSYSKSVSVTLETSGIVISPNPVTGKQFTISWASEVNETDIAIFNQLGQQVYEQKIEGGDRKEYTIAIHEQFTKGVYLLKIQGQGQQLIHKLLIQN